MIMFYGVKKDVNQNLMGAAHTVLIQHNYVLFINRSQTVQHTVLLDILDILNILDNPNLNIFQERLHNIVSEYQT